jgi:hypothetical protein
MSFSEANQINPVTAPDISFAIECLFGLEQPLREGPIPSSLCGSFRGVWRRSATNGLAVAASNSRLVGSSVAFQPVEQVSLDSQRPEREFPWIRHAILRRVKAFSFLESHRKERKRNAANATRRSGLALTFKEYA